MRNREHIMIRLLVTLGIGSVAAMFAAVVLLFATQHRQIQAAPDYRVVRIGGIEYEAMLGRPIHPDDPVDRAIVAGLAARDRRLTAGETLFGAFISVTNDSSRPLPTTDLIELRDGRGHVYRPLALPVANPYAYSLRVLRPGTRVPALGSAADDNLAATGRLVLFRIPSSRYDEDVLELVIHEPAHPEHTASLII